MMPNYKPFSEFLPVEEEIEVWNDAIQLMAGRMKSDDYLEKAFNSPPEKAFTYGVLYEKVIEFIDPVVKAVANELFSFLRLYPDKVKKILKILTEDKK